MSTYAYPSVPVVAVPLAAVASMVTASELLLLLRLLSPLLKLLLPVPARRRLRQLWHRQQ
jgi:hypothetical protein